MIPEFLAWPEAAIHVLAEAGQPIHYREVSNRIVQQGLTRSVGVKPAKQTNVALHRLLRQGRVVKLDRGIFALPTIANQMLQDTGEEIEADSSDPERLTVKAYGLYWSRDLVDWEATGPGKLLGHRSVTQVDFANQDGIYLLHRKNEVVYVGQTRTLKSPAGLYNRLKTHHTDFRRADRWEAFSWFGFRPVDSKTGKLLKAPETATIGDVINILEAIFIEGVMPRLNMRRGEGTKEWLEPNRYSQVRDREFIVRRFIKALQPVGQDFS